MPIIKSCAYCGKEIKVAKEIIQETGNSLNPIVKCIGTNNYTLQVGIFKNKQSELYYRESRVQNEGFVWFICEEKTGYFTSNSQLLFLEMELKQGLSREDYENETMDFFNYLERYDAYLRQKLLLQNI